VPLLNTFDRVLVISLRRRADRLDGFWQEIDRGWPFYKPKVFHGIDGMLINPPTGFKGGRGAFGAWESHRQILRDALQDSVRSVLVMEDDVKLWPPTGKRNDGVSFVDRVTELMRDIPNDWEQIFFGGQHWPNTKMGSQLIRPGVVRCIKTTRRHAYAVRGRGIMELYRFLSGPWWNAADNDNAHQFDNAASGLVQNVPTYAPVPWVCGQRGEASDIDRQKHEERWWF
jgi:hypothetical protein